MRMAARSNGSARRWVDLPSQLMNRSTTSMTLPMPTHTNFANTARTLGHEWRPLVPEHLVDVLADDAGLEDALPVHVEAGDRAVGVDVLCACGGLMMSINQSVRDRPEVVVKPTRSIGRSDALWYHAGLFLPRSMWM